MQIKKITGKRITGWGAILILALAVVVPVRYYLIGSYRIASPAMETAVWSGDFVIAVKRPFRPAYPRNAVVLFNSPLARDTASKRLFVSRCVGMPGDTLELDGQNLRVNGKDVPKSPYTLARYRIERPVKEHLTALMNRLHIPVREPEDTPDGYLVRLTPFEEYRMRDELPDFMNRQFRPLETAPYKLVVPRKGCAYRLDAAALAACQEIIRAEAGGKAVFLDGKLFLDGRETTFFFFQRDYYWLLSDNTSEAVDSRHVGFVPQASLAGEVRWIWLSKDPAAGFFSGYRWSRMFRPVH